MTPLSDHQKQLLFDYSLGLTSAREGSEAEALIASHEEAVELYQSMQLTLAPLESVEPEPCPDDLLERLFLHLREVAPAGPGQVRLAELLVSEQSGRSRIKVPLWRNWSEVVAAAAAVVLFVGILFPTVGHMRGRYWQARCGSNLNAIYAGLRNYVSDHDGLLPAVAMTPGSPWYKVGYQGQENHSNTRQIWLLPKLGYVDPGRFLCSGRTDARTLSYEGFDVRNLDDFPGRTYIHLSVQVPCPSSRDRGLTQKRVLLADRNPLAERFPSDLTVPLRLQLCETLLTSNSRNHSYRGQNVLLYDGSVEFTKTRRTRISDDDIYTTQSMSCGTEVQGHEFPIHDKDFFLAP
jgi:hypothetical protein